MFECCVDTFEVLEGFCYKSDAYTKPMHQISSSLSSLSHSTGTVQQTNAAIVLAAECKATPDVFRALWFITRGFLRFRTGVR
jgi:hypothetical protein